MRLGKPYSNYCQSKKEIITDISSLEAWHKINSAFQNKTRTWCLCFWPLPSVAQKFWRFSPFHAKITPIFKKIKKKSDRFIFKTPAKQLLQGKIKPCCAAGCFDECLYDNTGAPHSKDQNVVELLQDKTLLIPLKLESEQSIPTVLFADVFGLFVHPLPPPPPPSSSLPPPPPRLFWGSQPLFLGKDKYLTVIPQWIKEVIRSITPQSKSVSFFIISVILFKKKSYESWDFFFKKTLNRLKRWGGGQSEIPGSRWSIQSYILTYPKCEWFET